jgi:hypothetical protein
MVQLHVEKDPKILNGAFGSFLCELSLRDSFQTKVFKGYEANNWIKIWESDNIYWQDPLI